MADSEESTGTFSDLYDRMQQRQPGAATTAPETPVRHPRPKRHQKVQDAGAATPQPSQTPTRTPLQAEPDKRVGTVAPSTGETQQELILKLRRAARMTGRFPTSLRLTPEEKDRLTDIAYTYKKRQRKFVSENMMNRIAINFLLEDYETNGEMSILARVVDALME